MQLSELYSKSKKCVKSPITCRTKSVYIVRGHVQHFSAFCSLCSYLNQHVITFLHNLILIFSTELAVCRLVRFSMKIVSSNRAKPEKMKTPFRGLTRIASTVICDTNHHFRRKWLVRGQPLRPRIRTAVKNKKSKNAIFPKMKKLENCMI